MATELNQLDALKSILNELSLHDRVIESVSLNYEIREIPGTEPKVEREHTGVRTLTIVMVPKRD